eukprot:TRINITY_DN26541_c0_g1_i1.p2 TRINITY_DN26541_c0_g1~~TRINITY_DN26541_c0_g1_i1.p2  ORF type:complete len:185 (+),score=51.16 TRINITY_DN26541_c0_g1_i1:87-641(+)
MDLQEDEIARQNSEGSLLSKCTLLSRPEAEAELKRVRQVSKLACQEEQDARREIQGVQKEIAEKKVAAGAGISSTTAVVQEASVESQKAQVAATEVRRELDELRRELFELKVASHVPVTDEEEQEYISSLNRELTEARQEAVKAKEAVAGAMEELLQLREELLNPEVAARINLTPEQSKVCSVM